MKTVKLTESDLINLIEKLVKENIGFGNGQNFGLMGTPSAKYKDLVEDSDIEEDYETEDHDDRDEFDGRKGKVVGVDSDIDKQRMGESKKRKKHLSLTETQLIKLIEKVVNEQDGEHWPPKPTYEQTQDLKQIKACVNTIQGYEYTREGRSPYVGGTFMTEFMWHLVKSFDKDAENAKEIEYKIKQCFRNTVFWDEYGKALRFLGDDRRFRQEMKRLERGHIEGDI